MRRGCSRTSGKEGGRKGLCDPLEMGAERRRRLQQEVWCRDGVILGVGFGEEEEEVKICI